jgi:uncharacterized membrane protein
MFSKNFLFPYLLFTFIFTLSFCSESIQFVKEKAESEEGKKAIQIAKEKLSEKETQEKLKGLLKKKSPLDK